MKLIAHRGNISGAIPEKENTPNYILDAIKQGYDVEIDVWIIDGFYYLGHDAPEHSTSVEFLEDVKKYLWVHCKNIDALVRMKKTFNCFFHDKDDAVLSSQNYIWVYPDKQLVGDSICVLPEKANYTIDEIKKCYGICSDNVEYYKGVING